MKAWAFVVNLPPSYFTVDKDALSLTCSTVATERMPYWGAFVINTNLQNI